MRLWLANLPLQHRMKDLLPDLYCQICIRCNDISLEARENNISLVKGLSIPEPGEMGVITLIEPSSFLYGQHGIMLSEHYVPRSSCACHD